MSLTNNTPEDEEEIVSMLEKFKLPKTITVKCPYCNLLRDQSNLARHYKSAECTWTPEEAERRKTLKKLEKKKESIRQQYQERLVAIKAKLDAKLAEIDLEINQLTK